MARKHGQIASAYAFSRDIDKGEVKVRQQCVDLGIHMILLRN